MERKMISQLNASRTRFAERAQERLEGLAESRIQDPERLVEDKTRHLAELKAQRESVVQARDAAMQRAESRIQRFDQAILRLETEIAGDRKIVDNLSALEDDQRVVTGRVTLADGSPAAGVEVALTDEKGVQKHHLETATTDEAGLFSFQLKPREFKKFYRGSRKIVLDVEGGSENVKHTVDRRIGDRDQRLRLIDVRVPAKRGESKPKDRKRPRKPAPDVPVTEVPGVGKTFASRLRDRSITTAAQVAELSTDKLAVTLDTSQGRAAEILSRAKALLEKK